MSAGRPSVGGRREAGSVRMSILDWLLVDDERLAPDDRFTVEAFREGLRRDLEDLLNTRRRPVGWGAKLPEVETALTNYGIADFTAQPVSSDDDRERLRAGIEAAIRQAEPRFLAVAVHLLDNSEAGDRTLRLRIDALVAAEPAPEPMSFDGVVDPADRGVRVTATSDGGLI